MYICVLILLNIIYIYIYIYICFLVHAEGAAEDEDCERTDRDSADRRRHSELINLGAAGAGKCGKIGVCVTSRVTTSFTASFLLGSSFTSRGVYNSTPCTKACHTTN
jgi:hypothetical protein